MLVQAARLQRIAEHAVARVSRQGDARTFLRHNGRGTAIGSRVADLRPTTPRIYAPEFLDAKFAASFAVGLAAWVP